MKLTIKFIIVLFSLVVTGTTSVWGITEDDIIVNVLPNSSAGTVTVAVSGMNVTITATPATDYFIDASHIIAEKMVEPSVSHHAPGLSSSLPISGSNPFTFTIPDGYTGAYVTVNFYKKTEGFIQITSLSEITDMDGKYQLTADVSGISSSLGEFKGTLDGGLHKIIGSSAPLFTSTDGAIIRNIIFEDVNISSGDGDGDAGAVTPKAGGDTRIYNCGILPTSAERDNEGNITGFYGSSVSGTRYVGSLVGFLDGTSRVINCYSYANVSGGSHVGGIVGYNNVATTATNLKTMVMNCMFYGEVSGSSIAPIYNGAIITNVGDGENTGVSNYNYFRLESSYIQNTAITKVYNCALGAETRFLQRFEFFRHVLNSHRELAAWWATGSMDNKDEMMKWVLEPAQISSSAPFPILRAPGYYPSVVNIDAENAPTTTERNKGGKLGTLSVTIQSGSGEVFSAPTGAAITTSSLTLNITDKDFDHFNFNYYKVQLPYYNDVGTGNYTGNRVVTGWKIVSVTTDGSVSSYNDFTTGDDAPAYNFADRKCIDKDLYSVSGRVFNQGAYWDVPEGVTGITIQPYWAKAAYVADAYPDVVYNTDMSTAYNVPNVGGGQQYTNNTNYNIAGKQQKVYTTVANAVTALNPDASHTVHDYAVVLVGNVHQYTTNNGTIGSKKYTVTTIDLDHDNEPDYSFMLRNDGRNKLHPAKWDFLNIVGLGMAQKSTGGTGSYNQGIFLPLYWFETTNTSLFRVTQFEYDNSSRIEAPLILQGGVMEQWVSGQSGGRSNNTTYFHVGGNVWFKEFHRGTHQDQTYDSKHPPVSVTGGDYDEFYLTGLYTANVDSYADNAECYINGGRFGIVAGAAMEGIGKVDGADNTGNITWQVQNADIREFYAGGINAAKPVTGNLNTTITGGKIDLFCGGPKFGDMSTGKTVTTNATNCIFGTFFGAGYGGNSYSRQAPRNHNNMINFPHNDSQAGNDASWNAWLGRFYTQSYNSTYGGVSTQFSYQFLPMSQNKDNCGRIFVEYVKFSLATCRDVTSTLTGCKITGNFYGGGSLGKVDGPVASTLTNCEVQGSVFGAGFSASLPSVEVDATGFATEPYYYTDLGTYREGVKGSTTTYTWQKKTGNSWVDNTNHILYTPEDLTALGAVTGTATLTIDGTTTVAHSVYGGGEESGVGGDTEVSVTGGTIGTTGKGGAEYGNVFGGGKGKEKDAAAGLVKGNTNVTISGTTEATKILHNVYGGGAYGSVGDFTYDASGMPTALATANTGACTVTITGGTFGSNGHENGMVFGSSRGDVAIPEGDPAVDPNDRMAWVYSTHVTIGDANADTHPTIKGSVYGSGENGHTFQNTIVDINKGIIGITDTGIDGGAAYAYRGNVYGGGCGTDLYDSNNDGIKDKYNPLAGIVQGTTTINIAGGQVVHNVYGAGAMGSVGGGAEATSGKTTINITGGRIGYDGDGNGHIFGAARGEYGVSTAASGLANVRETAVNINYTTTPTADNDGKTAQLIAGSVFGGGEAGTVKESVAVNMTGGLILKDLYGGGALADTQTDNWDATANENAGGWADAENKSTLHTTTVRLTGGRVGEEVFGGGLGEAGKPAYVWGDVLVDLNGTTTSGTTGSPIADDAKGCVIGHIFGCNNINGTPKGDVMVHVYATQSLNKADISTKPDKNTNTYDVTAVYGGGNQAAYNPVTPSNGTSGSKTKVIIEGCALTSIETVYGGGNAAAVPETDVVIKGAYEIGYLFGGGNGKDVIAPGVENPGADVGTPDHGTTTYGTGNANTLMEGGLIHEAYGGSNTKGIIKGSINQITDPKDPADPEYCCDLEVEKIVGAGKYADVDGDVNMTLSCQPERKVSLLFAGADEANVNGNITLNITNGHFGKVFGGNNLGGVVKGKITVKVEETGCQPIKIDDLYLGGNEAAYSVFGYYEIDSLHPVTGKKILMPRKSATDSHTPVTNPAADASHTFPYADPVLNIISCTYIGNVFGGGFGKGAIMYANPTVNVNMVKGAFGDDEDKGVPKVMTELGLDVTKTAPNPDNLGIIRNVFGGGDAANVAGDTYVNIATKEGKSAYIIGSIFGGGNAADVLGNTNVTVSGGYVFNGIFGGGYAGSVGTFTRSTGEDANVYGHKAHTGCIGKPISCAKGTGKCTVVVNGGQIGPLSVATQGMNRPDAEGGPVPEGWVWGAGQGLVEDPAEHPDTHFTSYVGSTDVTIKGTALIMESIIGGGEFGRVLGNTLVKIEGGQIGIGANQTETVSGVLKPKRYSDAQFVNPMTTTITDANALTECSHYPYGKVIEGKKEYLPYDPYYDDNKTYADAHDLGPASTSNPSDGKTWIGCVFGGGSGYMPFKNDSGYEWVRSAGWVEGNSEVRISGGHILTNVYGGNEVTDVKGKSIVKMTGGTIGVPRTLEQIAAHPLSCYLFGAGKGDDRSHFYDYTNVGSVEVEISGGIIYGSVFGGSEDGHVTGDIKVDIKPGAIIGTWGTSYVDGNVFGAGRGFSGNTLTAGNVGGNVTLNISGGNILGSVYGGGRLASVGTYLVPSTDANYGKLIPDDGDDKHGHITINITGGTIGNDKEYFYSPTTAQKAAMPNTTFDYQDHLQYTKGGNVFTAGMGRLYALDNTTVLPQWQKLGQCKQTVLNMTGGTVKSSVYGGGEIGIVAQSATVNINGGTVGTKVVDLEDATKYYYFGSVFGGGKGSTENIEGISAAGTTQGNVEVHLNETVASNAKGAIVNQVFGCNDMNGSPKGTVTVHIYKTQNADAETIGNPTEGEKTAKVKGRYDIAAVYGGGNLAAYEPTNLETGKTNVIIDGCELTSIKQVYGGGNAASTPATNVTVNGTYEILELFGGGNGFDNLPDGRPNPGANVGYKNYTVYTKDGEDKWVASDAPAYDTKEERTAEGSAIVYGTGQASINVYGGTIHRVFGGSNTKGNVRQTAVTLLDEKSECEFCVDEAYGGGKSAPMDAEAKLLMACIPGLRAAYGGAEAAAIKGNVTLNITNGTFDRVFGGNNLSGTIDGSITVNIEEVGCRPIKIGELYGGGNQAGYSVYGYDSEGKPIESGSDALYDDPQVNVKSFTSIGKVFGGGYGSGATMVGNPTVSVNEVYGKWYNDNTSVVGEDEKTREDGYSIPSHAKGKMGAISEVFGGGNAAKVIGNTTVNIATLPDVYVVKEVTAGAALSEGCYTRSGAGTTVDPFVYTTATGTASADVTYYEKQKVLGVDIRGNVYGGGNNAEVTGNTNVNIGKKEEGE